MNLGLDLHPRLNAILIGKSKMIFSKPKIYYKGFSTAHFEQTGKSFSLSNIDLVKQDLINHIWTVKGERVMMPNFGTRIPDLVFEPLDQETVNIIEEDLREVINYDPRVELRSLNVYALPNNNAIAAILDVYYIEFKIVDTLNISVQLSNA